MRTILHVVLISLIGTCPIVCGTSHSSSGGGACGTSHRHEPHGNAPLPPPSNDDDCLCNGAIKVTDSHLDLDGPSSLDSLPPLLVEHSLSTYFPRNLTLGVESQSPSTTQGYRSARTAILRC